MLRQVGWSSSTSTTRPRSSGRRPRSRQGCSSFEASRARPSRSSLPAEGSRTSVLSMKDFPTRWKSTSTGTTPSCCDTGWDTAGPWPRRISAAAISYVFRNAGALEVSTENYSLWGSSAGARMAAAIGTHGVAHFGGAALPKPSTVVMAYTGHSEYSAEDPPTFSVVGELDRIALTRHHGAPR